MKQLQLLMNIALRAIEKAGRRTHTHTMLQSTDLLDVKQRVHYNVLMMFFRVFNNSLPDYLCHHFNRIYDIQPYQLRNTNNIHLPTYVTTSAQKSFKYKGAQLYNDFTSKSGIDASASETEFRKALKIYVKRNITIHRVTNDD